MKTFLKVLHYITLALVICTLIILWKTNKNLNEAVENIKKAQEINQEIIAQQLLMQALESGGCTYGEYGLVCK